MQEVKKASEGKNGYFCQATDPEGNLKLLPFKAVTITGSV
jgi:hypothetical protein